MVRINIFQDRKTECFRILLINDFIFSSKNIKKHYLKMKELNNKEYNEQEWRSLNKKFNLEIKELCKKYNHNCKENYLFSCLFNKFVKSTDSTKYSFFAYYFKKFIIKIANNKKIEKEKYKEYFDAIKKIREEYEQIKDKPTLQEKYPRRRF